jgi:NAD(P)-dependent dehydrogenase (short-subunit alcohol dehydrogenase family)
MKLKDKTVVVTGSGNGIGEAIARRFAEEGANVVVTDIEPDAVARVSSEIGCVGLACDITVEENVKAVARLARETYGEIDIWFSNAGYSGPRQPESLQDDQMWDLNWQLHVMSHVYAARECVPSMIERGEGYLLQTASVAALSIQNEKVAYSVTKHAALALSEWLAVQYRPKGIRVSCFCPGAMMTRMLRSNGWPDDHPSLKNAVTPEQVAEILVRGIDEEKFLILTNPAEYATGNLMARAQDYDGWIAGLSPTS